MNQHQLAIDRAITHAMNKKSTTGYSLFNPRRIKDNLHNEDITLSPKQIAILTVKALDKDYDKNVHIDVLCRKLRDNPQFHNRFIKQYSTPVNEYQLRAFCNEFKIQYSEALNWKPVMYRVFRLHASMMYKDALKDYESLKKETTIMPIDALSSSSTVSKEVNNDQNYMGFAQMVTADIIHTINNEPVRTMSKQQLFMHAINLEKNIKRLHKLKAKSKAVKKEVKCQKKVLKIVIKYLDAK